MQTWYFLFSILFSWCHTITSMQDVNPQTSVAHTTMQYVGEKRSASPTLEQGRKKQKMEKEYDPFENIDELMRLFARDEADHAQAIAVMHRLMGSAEPSTADARSVGCTPPPTPLSATTSQAAEQKAAADSSVSYPPVPFFPPSAYDSMRLPIVSAHITALPTPAPTTTVSANKPKAHILACPYFPCKSQFARIRDLEIHERTHTKEKPFVCKGSPSVGCRKKYAARSMTHFFAHFRTYHIEGNQQDDCRECTQLYYGRSRRLNKHIRQCHMLDKTQHPPLQE